MAPSTKLSPAAPQQPRFEAKRTASNRGAVSMDCMFKFPLFEGRDPSFVEALVTECEVFMYSEGDTILREGELAETTFFLVMGTVEILKEIDGVAKKVVELGAGVMFGEMALLQGGACKRTATVRAREFCDCRVIHQRLFNKVLKRFPAEKMYYQHMARQREADMNAFLDGEGGGRRNNNPRRLTMAIQQHHQMVLNILHTSPMPSEAPPGMSEACDSMTGCDSENGEGDHHLNALPPHIRHLVERKPSKRGPSVFHSTASNSPPSPSDSTPTPTAGTVTTLDASADLVQSPAMPEATAGAGGETSAAASCPSSKEPNLSEPILQASSSTTLEPTVTSPPACHAKTPRPRPGGGPGSGVGNGRPATTTSASLGPLRLARVQGRNHFLSRGRKSLAAVGELKGTPLTARELRDHSEHGFGQGFTLPKFAAPIPPPAPKPRPLATSEYLEWAAANAAVTDPSFPAATGMVPSSTVVRSGYHSGWASPMRTVFSSPDQTFGSLSSYHDNALAPTNSSGSQSNPPALVTQTTDGSLCTSLLSGEGGGTTGSRRRQGGEQGLPAIPVWALAAASTVC